MSSPLANFALVAESYIAFIDSFASARPENLYTTLELHLADLYSTILPVVAEMNEPSLPELEDIGMSHEQWHQISQLIGNTTGDETAQMIKWHEKIEGKDSFPPSALRAYELFDDLADIYRDLNTGLILWNLDTPESRIEASWKWRYNYDTHWGNHLFRASTTVHEVLYTLHDD